MIYLTQLIYIKPGEEESFHQFEDIAIPIIYKYKGQLLLRIRPKEETIIESGIEPPYEIHFVSFPSEEDFESFCLDEERAKFLYLKEQSIRTSLLVKGTEV
jgi:uncharacterized protein (DUF1330 family)